MPETVALGDVNHAKSVTNIITLLSHFKNRSLSSYVVTWQHKKWFYISALYTGYSYNHSMNYQSHMVNAI